MIETFISMQFKWRASTSWRRDDGDDDEEIEPTGWWSIKTEWIWSFYHHWRIVKIAPNAIYEMTPVRWERENASLWSHFDQKSIMNWEASSQIINVIINSGSGRRLRIIRVKSFWFVEMISKSGMPSEWLALAVMTIFITRNIQFFIWPRPNSLDDHKSFAPSSDTYKWQIISHKMSFVLSFILISLFS